MTDDNDSEDDRDEPLANLADEVTDDEPHDGRQDGAPDGTDRTRDEASDGTDRTRDGQQPESRDQNDRTRDGQSTGRSSAGDPEVVPGAGGEGNEADRAPLSELADQVDERRGERDDDLFEREFDDVGDDTDSEALWEDLEGGTFDTGVEEPQVEEVEDTYLVDKREYCQRCQFFSEPPAVRCNYQGSEILELVDTDQFQVRGCPIVEGTEDLQDLTR